MPIHDFVVWEGWRPALRAMGIRTMKDVLERGVCVRDLRDRANLRIRVEEMATVVYVKHAKPRRWRAVENLEHWGLVHAAEIGLPVPELVLAGTDENLGAVTGTAGLEPAAPLDVVLRHGGLDLSGRRRVLEALADAAAGLHGHRLHHRDLYLNHVFVDPARSEPLAAIIDWDRSGRHARSWGRRVVKDLAALDASAPAGLVSEVERLRFLVLYLRRRGAPGRRAARRLARRVRRKAARIRAHTPRTPVGDAARPRASGEVRR